MKEGRHKKTNILLLHLYETSQAGKFIEIESILVYEGWGRKGEEVTVNGYGISFFLSLIFFGGLFSKEIVWN